MDILGFRQDLNMMSHLLHIEFLRVKMTILLKVLPLKDWTFSNLQIITLQCVGGLLIDLPQGYY